MSYIDETAYEVTTPAERHALLAAELQAELDETILEHVSEAMARVNAWITRKGRTTDASKPRCNEQTPDEILASHGITFERSRRLYLAYDRAARVLSGIAVCGRGPYARRDR